MYLCNCLYIPVWYKQIIVCVNNVVGIIITIISTVTKRFLLVIFDRTMEIFLKGAFKKITQTKGLHD